jgi:hypothetical protein
MIHLDVQLPCFAYFKNWKELFAQKTDFVIWLFFGQSYKMKKERKKREKGPLIISKLF